MCYGCWQNYGKPNIINDDVIRASELVDRVYDYCSVGSNLHVQLDDWNLEDEFFQRFEPFLDDVSDAELEAGRECFDALAKLPFDQRVSVLAYHEGFIK